jgi:ankyrin repeat protein
MNRKSKEFFKAIEDDEISNVEALLRKDPRLIEAQDETKNNPLFFAISKEMVELLITYGANINARNLYGRTPLHSLASYQNGRDMVELLISKGADVNVIDNQNSTPLHRAVDLGRIDTVKLLLSSGADINQKNNYGLTPLESILDDVYEANEWEEMARILVKHGAYVEDINIAVGVGDISLIKSFIEREPKLINYKNRHGYDPLHFAVYHCRKGILEFLISQGADVNARDKANKTALTFAVERGYTDIADLLRKHGAKE